GRVWRDACKPVEPLLVLVGAEIERAYRHRMAVHPCGDLAIRLELLVLARQTLAVQKQKLAAEKPDAGGAVFKRLFDILGQLDIGEKLDFLAIERSRLGCLEPLELLALQLELPLLEPIFGQHRAIGVDDDDILGAVDDQEVALAY